MPEPMPKRCDHPLSEACPCELAASEQARTILKPAEHIKDWRAIGEPCLRYFHHCDAYASAATLLAHQNRNLLRRLRRLRHQLNAKGGELSAPPPPASEGVPDPGWLRRFARRLGVFGGY